MSVSGPLGFVGLGVMGEAMCRNLARKSGEEVIAFDLVPEPLARLREDGVRPAGSVAALAAEAGIVFLSLPGGAEVEAVIAGPGGILAEGRPGQVVVDHGTTPVNLTRRLAAALAERGIGFLDAPVARTRVAAVEGTLSVTVGGPEELFRAVRPRLQCVATDIAHCGGTGAGQTVKIVNNMVLIQTVVALADGLLIGERAGVDGAVLFDCLSRGSADSFALRNHGLGSLLPDDFPERAFPAVYALKDLDYGLDLAEATGVAARAARVARTILEEAIAAGHGARYFPVLKKALEERGPAG